MHFGIFTSKNIPVDTGLPLSLEEFLMSGFNNNRTLSDFLCMFLKGADGKNIEQVYVYGDGQRAKSLESEILFGHQVKVIRRPSLACGEVYKA